MKLYVSHGADPDDWFIVKPRPGETSTSIAGTPITSEMAIASLVAAGRTVYELDVVPKGNGIYRLVTDDGSYKPGPGTGQWDARTAPLDELLGKRRFRCHGCGIDIAEDDPRGIGPQLVEAHKLLHGLVTQIEVD